MTATPHPSDPGRGAVMALDVGNRRIGVAVTDAGRRFVLPRETFERKSPEADARHLASEAEADGVKLLAVGLPVNVDGTEGPQAAATRVFAADLSARTKLPFVFVDERYTSMEADEALRERFRDWRDRKARVDRGAAALILRTFLDHGPMP